MDAHARTVDHDEIAVVSGRDRLENAVPYADLTPPHEALVAGGERGNTAREVALGRGGAEAPEDAVEHTPVVHPGYAAWLVGQQRLDDLLLEISQLMTTR